MLSELRAWLVLSVTVLTALAGLVGYVAYLLGGVWRELHQLNGRLVRQEERNQNLTGRIEVVERRCERVLDRVNQGAHP